MPSSLIRGRYVFCGIDERREPIVVEDGAVFQENGYIQEIGSFESLAAKYSPDEIIGSERHVVAPGFVNAHHHVGLTPIQLGAPDLPLELWIAARMGARDVDPYLDTMYSAFEMIESGVTTVQHIRGFFVGGLERNREVMRKVLAAYHDIGMRVSYSLAVVDQNRVVYEADSDFLARLPKTIAEPLSERLDSAVTPLDDQFQLFDEFRGNHEGDDRVRIQLAPANLHWCSDRALTAIRDVSDKTGALMHMHLLETPYQKEYARQRSNKSALRHLESIGLLGPRMTLGHGVWLSEDDLDLVAESGTHICHNCSSNFRLRSGIAPLNAMLDRGINVGLGIDEAGINDDRDMLQEMRMVLLAHREPGMDSTVPTEADVLCMATSGGAKTTPFGDQIGVLRNGAAADLVVMNWQKVAYPYLDVHTAPTAAMIHRAKSDAVETILVGGEPIYRDGTFARVNKDDVLDELAAALNQPLKPHEEVRRKLSNDLFDHVRKFYEGYLDDEIRTPFDLRNSRH